MPSPDRNRRDRLEDFTKQMSAITDDNFQEFKDDLTNLEYYAGWDPLMLDINLLLNDVWDGVEEADLKARGHRRMAYAVIR